ncbi:MAG: glutamate--tRNA ligase [Spirochaetia bacterium]
MSVRVRYAPSPTGYQHIGGARTALFNYFFARAHGGAFILRVEDTDQTRYFDEALQDLYQTLDWLGIVCDEGPEQGGKYGPYIQSQRSDLYKKYTQELIDKGHAYHCYCSAARLERIRKIQEANGMAPGYDRHCRHLTDEERKKFAAECAHPVVRFKIPEDGAVTVHDELLGDVTRECKDINPDPILMKSDGLPTYHLANIVDDHLMQITHVLRAQEWLPSAPLHALLYQALGWDMPKLCHLPMVMGQDGQKLSKRHGATSVKDFRAKGYLPQAIVNYISLLGWSLDDSTEFFSLQDLCKFFRLERLNKAPAVFDYKKLDWFNGHYLRKLTPQELFDLMMPFVLQAGYLQDSLSAKDVQIFKQAVPLIQERLHYLSDVGDLLKFLFIKPKDYDVQVAIPKKTDLQTTLKILDMAIEIFEGMENQSDEELEQMCRQKAEAMQIKVGAFLQPVRVALTGSTVSPPLFGSLRLLGAQEGLARMTQLKTQLLAQS